MDEKERNTYAQDISELTKDMLHWLTPTPTDPPTVEADITIQEGYKIWSENTETSPEGRYLNLYKVWLQKLEK
eukprot:6367646-Ditylum_brightwellii.AAC.1